MKFIIPTQELNFLVSKCLNIIGSKPATMPLLANILVQAKDNSLTLTATDLVVGLKCSTEAKILEEGSTTLNAKRLGMLVKELTSVNLEWSTNEHEVTTILSDSSKFKLNGMSGKEFPELPELEEAICFEVTEAALKTMLQSTAFAVSREDNRFVLTGLNLQIHNGKAVFAATDGKRLARSECEVKIDPSISGQFTVPLRGVEEILKNLSGDGEIKVFLSQDKIKVQTAYCEIVSKLLTGEYPDVTRVIPSTNELVVSLHKDELTALLRQMVLFAGEEKNSVKFSFAPGELRLSANSNVVGEGDVSMPVNYSGNGLEIAFNPGYFLDVLRHTGSETVSMGLTDPYNPGIITVGGQKPELSSGASPLFVLMPMRIEE